MHQKISLGLLALFIIACGPTKQESSSKVKTIAVNPTFFVQENLAEDISTVQQKIRRNQNSEYYKISIIPVPSEHQMGPWCPTHISDGKEKVGIWFKDGKVYDVDGHFISNLKEFYSDDRWAMFREDGSVKVTNTQEACEAAARPDVDPEYQNHCVECLPEYYEEKATTYLIPVKPIYLKESIPIRREGVGLAFNGVKFDAPAPTHAILAAHTLAPLDDHGGHVNPHAGYHYHAATGSTKEIEQADKHSPMIGYAMDGFGIFARMDKEGKEPSNLDECGGHFDTTRGYHYHAGKSGDNQILKCLHGEPGITLSDHH